MPHLSDTQKVKNFSRILRYIQNRYKQKWYLPTGEELEKKFHTNLRTYGLSIREIYRNAGVPYIRDPNPFMRYRKEKKLANIVVELFEKMGYKLYTQSIGPANSNGSDLIFRTEKRELIPVELKAYHRFTKIGGAKEPFTYKRDEVMQLLHYISELKVPFGYLITTTNRNRIEHIPSSVRLILGNDLQALLLRHGMRNRIQEIEWIRNSSISSQKEEEYKAIRRRIISFVRREAAVRGYIPNSKIMQIFHLHPETYFPQGRKELYGHLGYRDLDSIPNYRMGGKFDKKKFIRKIISYIKSEYQNGRLPTYKEIQTKFRCLPKLYFPGGIRELFQLADIRYSRKFASKTSEEREEMQQKIITYVSNKIKNGYFPGYRDFRKDLQIGPSNYFKTIDEIYCKAGYGWPIKKTWRNKIITG